MSARDMALVAIFREIAREAALEVLREAQEAGSRPEGYITTAEAARRASVAQDTILAWISKEILPATRPPGVKGWKIRPADLEAVLSESTGRKPTNLQDHRAAKASALAAAALGKGAK